MKLFMVATFVLTLPGFGSSPALAADPGPGIEKRRQVQAARIVAGVKSGELTWREARGLVRRQRHIKREEHRYRADGHLSWRERAVVHRDLSRISRRIYREKHDARSWLD